MYMYMYNTYINTYRSASETSRSEGNKDEQFNVVQEDDVWMRDQPRHLYRHMPTQGQVMC